MLRAFSLTTLGILVVYGQVGVWGGWGGHTSVNDLTAAGEVWNRFYAVYSVGVRFLPERRVQPLIGWQGGSFISQNRELGQYARTSWNAIGLGLRAHLRKGLWSPFFQVGAHRFAISVRDQNGKPPHGTPSSIGVVGLSWAAGVRLLITEGVTFSLLYQRFRPQTNLLDGLAGPRKDRIEAIMGELLFYFPEADRNAKSRF